MKIVLINGSPNKNGNTYYALQTVASELTAAGHEAHILHIGAEFIHGCIGCGHCKNMKDNLCAFTSDRVNELILKIRPADAVVFGSPTYFAGIAGTMKSFLDRLFYTSASYFRLKPAAAVCAVRRTGGMAVFQQLNSYLHFSGALIVNANYWNVIHGQTPGQAAQDAEGLQTLKTLGKNMAWLLAALAESKAEKPAPTPKVWTNFIR